MKSMPSESANAKFKIEHDRMMRVASALGSGDLADCLMPDLKHVCEVLARILVLEDVAPGFLDGVFSELLPSLITMHNKRVLGAAAQQKADEAGFGDEWRAAIDAGNSPKQKDYLARMVALYMRINGATQAEAIRTAAQQLGRDEDSVRRIVTRSKARKG